jgi:hypothetical protein
MRGKSFAAISEGSRLTGLASNGISKYPFSSVKGPVGDAARIVPDEPGTVGEFLPPGGDIQLVLGVRGSATRHEDGEPHGAVY